MPAYFKLIDKETGEVANAQRLDNRMWRELGNSEPHPKRWYGDWYDLIGLDLALGKSFEEVRQRLMESEWTGARTLDALDFIAERYDVDSGHMSKY